MKIPNRAKSDGSVTKTVTPVMLVNFDGTPVDPDGEHMIPWTAYFADPGGSIEMNVAPGIEFSVTPTAGYKTYMNYLVWAITGSAITADKFGGLTALTNGIKLQRRYSPYTEAQTDLDFFAGRPLKTNATMLLHTNNALSANFTGSSNVVSMAMDFTRLLRMPIILNPNQKLVITIQDDLSLAPYFRARVYGYKIPIAST